MAWFKKKDKFPQLPPSPTLPEIPESSQEYSQLPPLPYQNQQESEFSGEKEVELTEIPDFTVDEPEMIPSITSTTTTTTTKEVEVPRRQARPHPTHAVHPAHAHPSFQQVQQRIPPHAHVHVAEKEPIFVRLDKFESGRKKLEEIKKSLRDIENTLKKLKETKQKEDMEIIGWSQEISNIKDMISEVDSGIFEKFS